MQARNLSVIAGGIILLLLAAGVAGALPGWQQPAPEVVAEPVASGIGYQGRLTTPAGKPLAGTFAMRFIVYDGAAGGTALWDSGVQEVAVVNGLFNVQLGVNQASFNGRALWLSIIVEGETLSPRQEILPAPYALSLRPGADIVGEDIPQADAVVAGYAPATGTAFFGEGNGGAGMYGESTGNYGVWGASGSSWGGYFTSDQGHGIRVETAGADIYDYGAYITSQGGYAVYAQSAINQALRGEAGNVSGIQPPLGTVGVVGLGQNRGVYGASISGSGVYGASEGNYGLWGQSGDWRGVTGRTNRMDNNYGIYTPDNLYSANINLAGAVMQVMQNGGSEPLSLGEVVVFSGIERRVEGLDGPVVQVSKINEANSTAVAGVVYSRFNLAAVDPAVEKAALDAGKNIGEIVVTPEGEAAPGEAILVVVQGPALVKTSAAGGGVIVPGDLLSTSGRAGLAGKAATRSIDGLETAVPGTVFAKALEPLAGGPDLIYAYVTLQ